jgi:hypothetical protein
MRNEKMEKGKTSVMGDKGNWKRKSCISNSTLTTPSPAPSSSRRIFGDAGTATPGWTGITSMDGFRCVPPFQNHLFHPCDPALSPFWCPSAWDLTRPC